MVKEAGRKRKSQRKTPKASKKEAELGHSDGCRIRISTCLQAPHPANFHRDALFPDFNTFPLIICNFLIPRTKVFRESSPPPPWIFRRVALNETIAPHIKGRGRDVRGTKASSSFFHVRAQVPFTIAEGGGRGRRNERDFHPDCVRPIMSQLSRRKQHA